ncbi:MAG: hypothetical protein EXS35_17745 [Pedosphaera sp.]|nr:hypothetical protein [Pedosphaera sp.]
MTSTRASRIRFDTAKERDDADIRRLLRESPVPGQVTLTLEREPDYFADADLPGEEKQTILAREGGHVICVGNCTVRERFINGQARRVGYLGGLRLDAGVAGRFDILRRGYDFFRELQAGAPADFYFTSITSDNVRARNFLERGLPGMPAYEFIGEFVTLLLPVERRSPTRRVSETRMNPAGSETGASIADELLALTNEDNRRLQFAPCWSADEFTALQPLGLLADSFHFIRDDGCIAAGAALWDQRTFKQTVIRSYAPWLARLRPALNLAARITSQPRLPAVGTTLAHAFVFHLAVAPDDTNALHALIAALREIAAARNIEFLTLGFAVNGPQVASLRRKYRCREYHSRIYVVRWPGLGGSSRELDGRCLGPEAALL